MRAMDLRPHHFAACPQCARTMRIESLSCWRCGTSVTGRLSLPLLARLPGEYQQFIERFLLANGSLSQVQKDMGCSYPKVRRLLNETMVRMKAELEAAVREKEEILGALESDEMTGSEAARLLRGLTAGGRDEG